MISFDRSPTATRYLVEQVGNPVEPVCKRLRERFSALKRLKVYLQRKPLQDQSQMDFCDTQCIKFVVFFGCIKTY